MIAKHLLTIIANEFTYDNQDKVNGYIQPVIYTFNKGKFVKDAVSIHYPHFTFLESEAPGFSAICSRSQS